MCKYVTENEIAASNTQKKNIFLKSSSNKTIHNQN